MTDFLTKTASDPSPYVCVDLSDGESLNPSVLQDRIEAVGDLAVDAVNVPLYRTEHLVSLVHNPEEAANYRERQLSREEIVELQETADRQGLNLSATVYDPDLLDWYEKTFDTPFVCFHGGDITYRRLLERASDLSIPCVISTAASTEDEIERALDWLEARFVLLQHEPIDPGIPSESDNAERIDWLAETFETPVGYRDRAGRPTETRAAFLQELDFWMPVLAEDDATPRGYGIEPLNEQLKTIQAIDSDSDVFPGGNNDLPHPDEPIGEVTGFRKRYRRSLMASRSLSAGDTLSEQMIRELRPGSGLPAENLRECIGMMVQRPTDPQEMIAY